MKYFKNTISILKEFWSHKTYPVEMQKGWSKFKELLKIRNMAAQIFFSNRSSLHCYPMSEKTQTGVRALFPNHFEICYSNVTSWWNFHWLSYL